MDKLRSFWPEDQTDEMAEMDYVVLGRHYTRKQTAENGSDPESDGLIRDWFKQIWSQGSDDGSDDDFYADVRTRIAFTYRTRFTPIPRDPAGPSPLNFTLLFRDNPLSTIENAINNPNCFHTDIGWGCMIRTGQSLLANALQIARLGRSFRVSVHCDVENDLLSMFSDTPEKPFSIHKFVDKGSTLSDKKPGEWFGPAATAKSIQSLIHENPGCGIDNCIVSVSSGDISVQEVQKIFDTNSSAKVMFLMGLKLGLSGINESYWPEIRQILASKYSIGIAGGRPSSSLYFFGYRGKDLLYFDPHSPQLAQEELMSQTCHSSKFGILPMTSMDPSMLVGFLIQGQEEWDSWKQDIETSTIINVLDSKDLDFESILNPEILPEIDVPSEVQDNDYVDIGTMLAPGTTVFDSPSDNTEIFQDVQCKRQDIVVLGNTSNSVEVEEVLVADESTKNPCK